MRLTLNNDEIESAIKVYVETQGVSTKNKHVEVTLNAKRGDGKGGRGTMEAVIDISEATSKAPYPDYEAPAVEEDTEEELPEAKSLFGQNEEN